MACNDDRARQVMEACKIAGLHVPEEVAIIGVDNDDLVCNLSHPPLSSIALNFERSGYEAAELLDKLMTGEKMADQRIVVRPTHIVTRQSTDILAIEDREVAKAVRFIRQHSKEPIQVSDVVDAVLVSRRSLYHQFRRVLGRSPNEEIRRTRVEQIVRMLVETNLPVSKIAFALGYSSVAHIARYFRQEKGMNLQSYRKLYGRK
jgi:LacI family transcriptional regulator